MLYLVRQEHHNQSGGRSVGTRASYYLTFRPIFHSPTAHTYLRRFFTNSPTFRCQLLHHTYSGDSKLTAEYSKHLGLNYSEYNERNHRAKYVKYRVELHQ